MGALPWLGGTPRAWQAEVIPQITAALARGSRPVVVAATGAGKSITLAELLAELGGSAVVVAPTQRLVEQLSATLRARLGDGLVGVYYGRKKQPDRPVVVCCAPSLEPLVDEGRRGGLLVIDEAHRSEAERIRSAVPRLAPESVLGFSATPYLTDTARSLSIFDKSIDGCTLVRALDDGILVPWEFRRWQGPALEAGGTEAIDAACAELIARHAIGPGLVTAASIRDATAYAARLSDWDCPAEPISSSDSTKEQTRKILALQRGDLMALVQVKLLAEGVDLPWLRWLCLRTEIQSAVDFVQVVGRILRVHPGKDLALVLDPHLLGLRIGLEHGARVGAEELDLALRRALEEREGLAAVPPPVEIPPPLALGTVAEWLAGVLAAVRLGGLPLREEPRWLPGHPTPRAIAILRQRYERGWKVLPSPVKPALKALVEAAEHATAADVAIATAILGACADYAHRCRTSGGGWRWSFRYPDRLLSALPAEPPGPVLDALARLAEPRETQEPPPLVWESECAS